MKLRIRALKYYTVMLFVAVLTLQHRGAAQFVDFEPKRDEDSSYVRYGFQIGYERFVTNEMKNVYGGVLGFHCARLSWDWDQIGLLLSAGVVGGEGTPRVIDSSWSISSSTIAFWAIDLRASAIVRLTEGNPMTTYTPYLGVGFDAMGATEKLTISMAQGTTLVRGDGSALRGSIAGHGAFGLYVPTGMQHSVQVELKFLVSAPMGYRDLFSDDQKKTFEQKIYSVVRRPDFNFTGVSLSVIAFLL